MAKIKVVAFDPSISNFAIAKLEIDTTTLGVTVNDLILARTEPDSRKTTLKTSDDLRRAKEVQQAMVKGCEGAAFAFSEIPWSHATMYQAAILNTGMVVGILSSCPLPIIQVTPQQVKLAAVGHRQATKEEMIEWAISRHPDAPWIMTKRAGKLVPTAANEHLADAVATAYAGIHTEQFKQVLGMYQSAAAS